MAFQNISMRTHSRFYLCSHNKQNLDLISRSDATWTWHVALNSCCSTISSTPVLPHRKKSSQLLAQSFPAFTKNVVKGDVTSLLIPSWQTINFIIIIIITSITTLYWPPLCNKICIFMLKTYFPFFLACGAATQRGSWSPNSWGFLDHTQRRITVGRTPLDEWSARRRDLYLTTQNTHNRQTSTPPVGFEPTISAGELPQTYALDRTATGTDTYFQ